MGDRRALLGSPGNPYHVPANSSAIIHSDLGDLRVLVRNGAVVIWLGGGVEALVQDGPGGTTVKITRKGIPI